jgi:LemA protein
MKSINSSTKILAGVFIFAIVGMIIAGGTALSSYSSLAKGKTSVEKSWSDIDAAYQRRADLIPNLVTVAEKAAVSEKDILQGVVEARSKATSASIPVGDTEGLSESQGEVSNALNRLLAVTEAYPTLQSNQNWLDLQAQIEGTENRIFTARRDYNDTAEKYNSKVVGLPSGMFATAFGFEKENYFKADSGASTTPKITFD